MKSRLLAFLLLLAPGVYAQTARVDHLLEQLQKHPQVDTEQIRIYRDIAQHYRQLDMDSALSYSKKALAASFKLKNKKWVVKSYITLGITFGYMGNFEQAIDCFLKANLLTPPTERMSIGENYNRLGMCYKGMTEYEKAENSFHQYLNIALQEKDTLNIIQAHLNLGVLFGIQGKTSSALNNFNESLKLAELRNDSMNIANVQHNFSNLYIMVKEYQKALEYGLSALAIIKQTDQNITIIQLENTVGSAYTEMNKSDSALLHLRKGEILAQKIKLDDELYRIYTNMGIVFTRINEPDSALYYFNKSLAINDLYQDPSGSVYNYSNMAELYSRLNQPDETVFYAEKAMAIAEDLGILPVISANASSLYDAYKKKGDYAKALHYHEMFKKYEDSVRSENSLRAIELEQYNFSLERKNSQIALLGKENQLHLKENQIQRNYLWAGGIIGLIVLIVTFVYFQQARIRKRLNNTLKKQNEEIQHQALRLKEVNQLKDKVIAVMSRDVKAPVTAMYSILEQISLRQLHPTELPDMLSQLSRSANDLSLLIENILGWVNTQINRNEDLKLVSVNLREAGEEVLRLYKPMADQKYITLINLLPEDYFVLSHKNSLLLILRNLISNAIKFSPETHIVELLAAKEQDQIIMSVKDFGVGMDQQALSQLFNPYELYTTPGTNNEKGTGLGLLFAKESIEHLGGKLSMDSVKGKGTTFSFSLKMAQTEMQKQDERTAFAPLT